MQINLLIKKFRVWINDHEGIELHLKRLNRTFYSSQLLQVKEGKSFIVSPSKYLNSFFFPLFQILFLNENFLYKLCDLKVILVVRIVLPPILLHKNVDDFLVPEVIPELIFVGESELIVFYGLNIKISLWSSVLTFVFFSFRVFLRNFNHSCCVGVLRDLFWNVHRVRSSFDFLLLYLILWQPYLFLFAVQRFLFPLLLKLKLEGSSDCLAIKLLPMHTADGILSWLLVLVLNNTESFTWATCGSLQLAKLHFTEFTEAVKEHLLVHPFRKVWYTDICFWVSLLQLFLFDYFDFFAENT